MNRHERRALAAAARGDTREARKLRAAAEAAIAAALEVRGLPAALITEAPGDINGKMCAIVAAGAATAMQAAEALELTFALGDATETGELSPEQGTALMEKLGRRHLGEVAPD